MAPLLVGGYAIGIPWGPKGVAVAYSTVMMVSVIPLIAWSRVGTPVLFRDLLLSIGRPMLAGVVAAAVAFAPRFFWGHLLSPLPRLALCAVILSAIYLWILLYILRQKQLYVEILRGFFKPPSTDEAAVVSA